MEIPKNLKDDIWNYCRINDISNIDEFTIKLIRQGFTAEKFGSSPIAQPKDKIIEKIVEVPVEKIVEVIKEVVIEKEVYITDDSQTKELSEKVIKLEEERDSYKKDSEHFKKEWDSTLQKLELEKNKNKRDFYGE
jgi:hypothetical protein